MARAPRVFTWSDGLHAYTVAVSSKAKALAAWGVERDLFRDGEAREIEDGPAYDAAVGSPGEVVRTELEVKLPNTAVRTPEPAKPKTPRPSKADLVRAKVLDRALTDIRREEESLSAEIAARRARLERETAERRGDLERRREALEGERAALRAKLDGV